MVAAAGPFRTRSGRALTLLHGERNFRIIVGQRLAHPHEIVVHRLGHAHGRGHQRASVAVEIIGNGVHRHGLALHEILGAQQAELLRRPDAEQDGAAGLRSGGGKQAGGFHGHGHAVAVIDCAGAVVVGVQVPPGHHVLFGILAAAHYAYDVVERHGAAVEVVADVEFQLEELTPPGLFLYHFELSLVQADIAGLGEILHRDVECAGAVVHNLQGHLGGTDESEHPGLHHFLIKRCGHLFVGDRLSGGRVAVLPVPAHDLHVAAVDFLIGGDDFGTLCLRLFGAVYRQTVRFGVEQHPGALERALHTLQLAAGMRFYQHGAALPAVGAGGVGGGAEMEYHPVFAEHTAAPGAAAKADGNGARLLHQHLQAPGFELLLDPGFGLRERR